MPLPPFVRYPGSKTTQSPQIEAHVPPHNSKCIPFLGSGGYFLNSSRSKMESVNDLNGDLINLFIVMRDRRDELIEKIEATYYNARELYIAQQPTDDDLERARRFYTRCWLSFKPYENGRPLTFRRQYNPSGGMTVAAVAFSRIDHLRLISARLDGVVMEQLDALDYIQRYDHAGAFFYADPPYPFDARVGKNPIYLYDNMDEQAHTKLAAVLNQIKGTAIVSGYACPLYEELYERVGWQRIDTSSRVNGSRVATESLWLHPRAQVRRLF